MKKIVSPARKTSSGVTGAGSKTTAPKAKPKEVLKQANMRKTLLRKSVYTK